MAKPRGQLFSREDDDAEQGRIDQPGFEETVEDKDLAPLRRNQTQAEQLRDLGLCMCGCGKQPKGRDSRFAGRGHDRRVEGRIVKAVGGIDELQIIIERHLGRPI